LYVQVSGPRAPASPPAVFFTSSGLPRRMRVRPQSVSDPSRPGTRIWVLAWLRAALNSSWYSFSGVSRLGSRRAQKIFWNSTRSTLSLRFL
jgi:hypothetical protein